MRSTLDKIGGALKLTLDICLRFLWPKWRSRTVILIVTGFLASCGGGTGDQGAPQEAPLVPSTVVVKTSIDSSLQGQGALVLPTALSTVETQQVGVPIAATAGTDSLVFAVDAAGNIALAATSSDGSATFSAESTVLAFGASGMTQANPTATSVQLQTALRNADGYTTLVNGITSAVLAGKNPLNEADVQQGFDKVLSSALQQLVKTQQGTSIRPLAVAPLRPEPNFEPSVFETKTFRVSMANQSAGELTFASSVYLRNTSTLNFKAALLDVSGAQRTSDSLKGAGPSISSLVGADLLKIHKPFEGSFSVRLMVDEQANKAAMINGAVSLSPFKFSSDCIKKLVLLGSDARVDIAFGTTPLDWLSRVLEKADWKLVAACAAPHLLPETVLSIVKTYARIVKVLGFGRMALDLALVLDPIPDTGVCVNDMNHQISCVAVISAPDINPMMPGTVQPMVVKFFDIKGGKTSSPPYGLDIKYETPGLVSLSDTLTQIISHDIEGVGGITLTDPATDTKLSLRATVTNGMLDLPTYSAPVNGSTSIQLIDPVSRREVYRSPAFRIDLADPSFGSFEFRSSLLGGIFFQAADKATVNPQPIMLGTRESGSNMSVDGTFAFEVTEADPPLASRLNCVPYNGPSSADGYFNSYDRCTSDIHTRIRCVGGGCGTGRFWVALKKSDLSYTYFSLLSPSACMPATQLNYGIPDNSSSLVYSPGALWWFILNNNWTKPWYSISEISPLANGSYVFKGLTWSPSAPPGGTCYPKTVELSLTFNIFDTLTGQYTEKNMVITVP